MVIYLFIHLGSILSVDREILQEYSTRLREVGINLLRGISKSLGLEESYIEKAMDLESGYDFFTANDYLPRVSAPNIFGQFPHTDPGLLILLMQNISGGLQLEHKGKWVNANLNPNCIIVNLADHLEVHSNFLTFLIAFEIPFSLTL